MAIDTSKQLEPGTFVSFEGNIGHLAFVNDDRATIEFFDAPDELGRIRKEVPRSATQRVELERRTRIWFQDCGIWRMGRVNQPPDADSPFYLVDLPDQKWIRLMSDQIFVRWSRPFRDPTRLLIAKASEVRFFHKHRSQFVHEVLRHVAAAKGLSGISSSGVELHRHQVTAARRVLLDPIKRYLLADEVGLGKTIEAGMIVRQLMIDQPESRCLVIAPDPLVHQWETEIENKFRFKDLNQDWGEVQPHSWLKSTLTEDLGFDFVVVDEAHRVVIFDVDATSYQNLEKIAAQASALLLLSATPVRSNEEPFLRLLHLLDPFNYRLEDVESFRRRIENRDGIGNAISLLREDSPGFLIPEAIAVLQQAFRDDLILAGHLKELTASLGKADEPTMRSQAGKVRHYVNETYRLHRRMIRTRRNDRLNEAFPVRRRMKSEDWMITDDDPRRHAIVESLDRFRSDLIIANDLPQTQLLRVVGDRLCGATPAIQGLVDAIVEADHSDLSAWEGPVIVRLAEHPMGMELANSLIDALALSGPDRRIEAATDWAWRRVGMEKLVAFSSFSSVARATYDLMAERYGEHRVACLLTGMSVDDLERAALKAREDPFCTLLVCDQIAEEGWNLQFADEVLHLDVPWSANRLEQRLGRFDRFMRSASGLGPIKSTIFVDSSDLSGLTHQYVRLFDEGFGIFETSCASLQYVFPEREERALRKILDEGFLVLGESMASEAIEIAQMKREIEGQDLLDSLEDTEADDEYFDFLASNDQRHAPLREAFDNWVCKVLNFSRSEGAPPWIVGVSSRNPPLLPESEVQIIGIDTFRRKYVFDRKLSEGRSLVRPGEPFLDRLLHFSLGNDRGLAFADYLGVPGLPQDTQARPFFFFDVLIEPSLESGDTVRSGEVEFLQRLCMQYCPTVVEGIWLLPGKGEPTDKLRERLANAHSESLNEVPDFFDELTRSMDWTATCRAAEADAKSIIFDRSWAQTRLPRGLAKVREDFERFIAQVAARDLEFGENEGTRDLQNRQALIERAIQSPVMRIDSCGVVFVGAPR